MTAGGDRFQSSTVLHLLLLLGGGLGGGGGGDLGGGRIKFSTVLNLLLLLLLLLGGDLGGGGGGGGDRFQFSTVLNLLLLLLPLLLGGETLGGGSWMFFYLLTPLLGGLQMQGCLRTALLFLGGQGVAPALKTYLLFPVLLLLGGSTFTHSLQTLLPPDLPSSLLSFPRSHSLSLVNFFTLSLVCLLLFFYLASTVHTSPIFSLFSQLSLAPKPSSLEMTHRDKDSVELELDQNHSHDRFYQIDI